MSAPKPTRRPLTGTLAAFAVTALAGGTALSSAGPATAAPGEPGLRPSLCGHDQRPTPQEYLCAKAGDLVEVRIGDVRPTQPSLGHDEVYYKLGRFTLGKDEINKKFDEWCETNGQAEAASAAPDARLDDPTSFTCALPVGEETPESVAAMKTVVIGPGGSLYLTDGHHTLTSLYELPDGGADLRIRLRVVANLSQLPRPRFWDRMKAEKWVWLRDAQGDAVEVDKLPRNVGLDNFGDDPYRSLLYFGRDIGYEAGTIPFQEFYWGAWVRDTRPAGLDHWNTDDLAGYLGAVESLTKAQTALSPDSVVDSGRTAGELGVLAAWNDGKARDKGEFGKLAKPYDDAKPGKLAYALAYKARLTDR
ncbi:ParB/Srx family N-terminal domain-containing protein [Streptomyces sp. NPDC047974]|uniref:ParB/Srx family N-terminal domain-containing protein n=1 Tax=Streptomyces sp. NPDC047974 TaxID=3154343 RepID=UPI003408CFB1